MRLQAAEFGKDMLIEIAWLLGSWAISFGLVGAFIGFGALWGSPVTVQLHNLYIRLTPSQFALPGFLFLATVVAGMRTVTSRFKRPSTWVVMAGLGVGWGLLLKFSWWMQQAAK